MSFWQKTVQGGFVALFTLVPLIWLPNTSELFEFPKIIATYILTIIIVGAWMARCITDKKFIFRRTLLDWPILIFLISNLLSLIFSIDTHVSLYGYYSRWNGGLLSLLSYSLLYWAFVSNMDRKSSLFTVNCSLLTAALVAIYGSLEHFGWSPSCLLTRGSWAVDCWVQDVQNRVFATLGQPNWMAAYLVALIFVPLSALNAKFKMQNAKLQFKNLKITDWGQTAIFLLLYLGLLFTKSRSGLLAFGISVAVYWAFLLREFKTNLKNFSIIISGFTFCILLLTLLIPNPIRDFITKSQTLAPVGPALEVGGTESGNIRKIVWTGAIRIWRGSAKNLLVGTGLETFAESYYQFRPVEHNLTSEWELLYNKAHNEFLNYLATTGLVGLASYLILLVTMGRIFIKTIYDHRITMNDNFMTVSIFAGWLSLPITNFWGFSVVVVQLLMFLLPAMAIVFRDKSIEHRKMRFPPLSGTQIFLLLLTLSSTLSALYLTARYWWADVKYSSGLNAVKTFQATNQPQYLLSAYQLYTAAYALNPAEPAISSELSVATGYLANSLRQSDSTSASQLAQIAIAASDKAIHTSPHHPNYYKSRARTMILLSEIDHRYLTLAAEALAKAAAISPTDPRIPYNLGIIYNYMSATPSAIEQFKKSLSLKPDFPDPQAQLKELESR